MLEEDLNEECIDFSIYNEQNKLFNINSFEDEKDYDCETKTEKENSLIDFLNKNIENYYNEENANKLTKEKNNEKFTVNSPFNSGNKLDFKCKPFFPKNNLVPYIPNFESYYINDNNGIINNPFNYLYNKNNLYCYNNKNKEFKNKYKKNKNKKKKNFIEREGDWCCYDCKNINFSFRDKCNKCQLLKEESENKYNEAGKKLLKLFQNCSKPKEVRL